MKHLILISGKYRSGKDTFANMLKKADPSVRTVAFASPIKSIVADTLGLTLGELEDYKNGSYALAHGIPTDSPVMNGGDVRLRTYREILQVFGSGEMKRIFGENVWVDAVAQQVAYWFNFTDIVVVTDWRFQHEYWRCLEHAKGVCQVHTVRVTRDGCGGDGHVSEIDLDDFPFEQVVSNNGSLEDLQLIAEAILKENKND